MNSFNCHYIDLHSNFARMQSPDEDFLEIPRIQSLQEAVNRAEESNELDSTLRMRQKIEDEINSEFGRSQWIEDEIDTEPLRRQWIQDEFDPEIWRRQRIEDDFPIYYETSDVSRNYTMAEIDEMILTAMLQESFIHAPTPLQPVPDIILRELPMIELDEDKLTKYRQCSICLEDFVLKENGINLTCNHFYHEVCIKRWFKKQNMCPICKQPFVSPK